MFDYVELYFEVAKKRGFKNLQLIDIHTNNVNIAYENNQFSNKVLNINKTILQSEHNNKFGEIQANNINCNVVNFILDELEISSVIGLASRHFYEPYTRELPKINRQECFRINEKDIYKNILMLKDSFITSFSNWELKFLSYQTEVTKFNIFNTKDLKYHTLYKHNAIFLVFQSMNLSNGSLVFIHSNNIKDEDKLIDIIGKDLMNANLNSRSSCDIGTAKGYVRFSYEVSAKILLLIVYMFHSEHILNKRLFINNMVIGEKIFKSTINIIDNPLDADGNIYFEFDCQGVKTTKKYLIKDGKINDYLNNIRTQQILGGTAGNVWKQPFDDNIGIRHSNVSIEINEHIYENANVYINQLDMRKCKINMSTGIIDIFGYGYSIDENEIKYKSYRICTNIIGLVNKMRPSSECKWVDGVKVPQIVVEIL